MQPLPFPRRWGLHAEARQSDESMMGLESAAGRYRGGAGRPLLLVKEDRCFSRISDRRN